MNRFDLESPIALLVVTDRDGYPWFDFARNYDGHWFFEFEQCTADELEEKIPG